VVLSNDQLNYPLLRFILGESRHSKYTEPFYCNTILPFTFNKTLEVNDEGKIMNLFQPININTPDVAWYCNDILCNINCKYSIPRVLKIIKYLLSSELNNFPEKIKNIDLCNSESRNIFKLGHTSACYVENYCSSILLFLTNLAYHFPSIQELVLCLYKIWRVQMKVNQIDWAIHNININMLDGCKKSRVHISSNYIIQLNEPNDTKTVTMHSMLNDMSKEVTIENITCSACNTTSNHTQTTNILNTHEYLYFQIQLWSDVNTKITNLQINSLPTTTLTVDSKCYTLNSVICHHGQSMTEAHYTAIIKHQNKWVRCNDTSVQFERWPRGAKDVYIIIMEKK